MLPLQLSNATKGNKNDSVASMSNNMLWCNPNTAAATTGVINVANVVWLQVHLHTYIRTQSISVCVARIEENNWCCAPLSTWIYDALNTRAVFTPVRQLSNWTPATTHERGKDIIRGRCRRSRSDLGCERNAKTVGKKNKQKTERGRELRAGKKHVWRENQSLYDLAGNLWCVCTSCQIRRATLLDTKTLIVRHPLGKSVAPLWSTNALQRACLSTFASVF